MRNKWFQGISYLHKFSELVSEKSLYSYLGRQSPEEQYCCISYRYDLSVRMQVSFRNVGMTGLFTFPSMYVLSPSNNSSEDPHRPLEMISVPVLCLLLDYEHLEGSSIA